VFALELAEEILSADEVIVENAARDAQQVADEGVTDGVPDTNAFLASGHDVVGTKYCQLLRHDWLVDAEHFLQLLDALLALNEQLEDPNPNRVCQGPKERSLERLEFVSGDFIHISKFYSTETYQRGVFHRHTVPRIVADEDIVRNGTSAESHAPTIA